ncbi:MAG: Integrase family protein [Candidatus Magnetoglobus multicellularis str. Araruama]|uniref:Integrase family protein n=1 Tax=Candidatus Magnetoglobus multicellularis str. Araruama TaxID=890399 RepID=A0A1V1PBR3_9BACT|nr:MAG: Integrase family protein [Candidatus Magnetoglobus multicellularis str. Araruama]
MSKKELQTTTRYNFPTDQVEKCVSDTIDFWSAAYFKFEVTSSQETIKNQERVIDLFKKFMLIEVGDLERVKWSPRLTSSFIDHLKKEVKEKDGIKQRRWSDNTIHTKIAHLKTFAKWIHKHKPFPLGNPTEKIKITPKSNSLDIERALTRTERNNILDAADTLSENGVESIDRNRYKGKKRPKLKKFQLYRNRAIIYTLIETGMRRSAVTSIDLHNVDFEKKTISVIEKGGLTQKYKISKEGLEAIKDYIDLERSKGNERWNSPALFLSNSPNKKGNGRLTPQIINRIWTRICETAKVNGKTPHSARHAMGKHIIDKTGNIAAVQRQLGHKNVAYSVAYSRIGDDELQKVLDDR